MHGCVATAVGDGQHRDFHLGVLLLARDRQSPEMGRRPRKNNEHQQERVTIDLIGDSRPTQQRRHRAGQSTDHDVLGRRAFKVERIDKGIANERSQSEPGGQGVHPGQQHHHSQRAQYKCKNRGALRINFSFDNRSSGGARHHGVDMLIREMINRSR